MNRFTAVSPSEWLAQQPKISERRRLRLGDSSHEALAVKFDFGKHRGLTVAEVAEKDMNYLLWLLTRNPESMWRGRVWLHSGVLRAVHLWTQRELIFMEGIVH
ncbi:MAG: hypothetical protein AB7P99_06905 [Vicinamibacterales bacterium]